MKYFIRILYFDLLIIVYVCSLSYFPGTAAALFKGHRSLGELLRYQKHLKTIVREGTIEVST